jgi:hypothetical protein
LVHYVIRLLLVKTNKVVDYYISHPICSLSDEY